jgi:hypothetical protein
MDLFAQSRLSDVEPCGSAGEIELFRDGNGGLKQTVDAAAVGSKLARTRYTL